jgi:sec-independent protein translocase protein TatB
MLDMSWGEVLVIGAVALVVIGPKDLPKALRTLGNMTASVRRMASEFQSQFNEAMREAELDEIKKQVSGLNEEVSSINSEVSSLNSAFDPVSGASATSPPPITDTSAPTAPRTEPAAAPLPGEPAFDLALPSPPPAPDVSGPQAEPVAGPAPEPRRAESHKA